MQMPGRHGVAGDGYRYGFQGQEGDDEVKGPGNSVNYRYRMHDPRIGRFFAVDPLAHKFVYFTPYNFAGNKPSWSQEMEGLQSFVDAKWERYLIRKQAPQIAAMTNGDAKQIEKEMLQSFNNNSFKGALIGAAVAAPFLVPELAAAGTAGGFSTGSVSTTFETAAIFVTNPANQQAGVAGASFVAGLFMEGPDDLPGGYDDAGKLLKGFFMSKPVQKITDKVLEWADLKHMAAMREGLGIATSTDGSTFRAVIQNIESHNGDDIWSVLKGIRDQAADAGASKLEIRGVEIVNSTLNKIFKDADGKELMGYKVSYSPNVSGYGQVDLTKVISE